MFSAKKGAIGSIVAILVLTVLEFPAPIGFETRPQTGVSIYWLVFFLLILVSEIAAMPLILKHQKFGAKLGIFAAILNIFQVVADQLHLLQPEVAPLGYSILEYSVVLVSLLLGYFSANILSPKSITISRL